MPLAASTDNRDIINRYVTRIRRSYYSFKYHLDKFATPLVISDKTETNYIPCNEELPSWVYVYLIREAKCNKQECIASFVLFWLFYSYLCAPKCLSVSRCLSCCLFICLCLSFSVCIIRLGSLIGLFTCIQMVRENKTCSKLLKAELLKTHFVFH